MSRGSEHAVGRVAGLVALLLVAGVAVADEAPRYRHRLHGERFDVEQSCAACHALTPEGRQVFPGSDAHRPCAGCHADFRQRPGGESEPGAPAPIAGQVEGFCRTCHLHGEPWRANPVRAAHSTPSEFEARFPHGRPEHRSMPCARCHPVEAGGAALAIDGRLAPTHRLCVDCHGELASPRLSDCGGCHRWADGAAAVEGGWRVAGFDHALHAVDVRTAERRPGGEGLGWQAFDRGSAAPLACAACHGARSEAADTPMGRPTMSDCDDCHDGQHAFSTTGFDCARCHRGGHAR